MERFLTVTNGRLVFDISKMNNKGLRPRGGVPRFGKV